MITDHNAHGLLRQLAWNLQGAREEGTRGGRVRVAHGPVVACLTEPRNRMHCLPDRGGNPWVSLAEFPWLMAGRNDLAWLGHYLPRAGNFSDDYGSTWRAGYGPRLRAWGGYVDQISEAVHKLRTNPDTRQAVVSLWDPETDNIAGSKDYPCTLALHFQRQGGKLDLTAMMRSNDLIWGFSGVNLVNFTLLLEAVAIMSDIPIGRYYHVASNLHVYEQHWGQVRSMGIGTGTEVPNPYMTLTPSGGLTMQLLRTAATAPFKEACEQALQWLTGQHGNHDPQVLVPPERLGLHPSHWLLQWMGFMRLHEILNGPPGDDPALLVAHSLAATPDPTWRLSLAIWAVKALDDWHITTGQWKELLRNNLPAIPSELRRDMWIDSLLARRLRG